MTEIPAKQIKKKPASNKTKEEASSRPSLLDQILGVFKKKAPEPPPRRSRPREQPVPPP